MMRPLLTLSILCATVPVLAQRSYPYSAVPGDPTDTRIYTLGNGLQVWLSRNADAPRVQTNIVVRAGSKNDPADATGLAHYLEHMLFKGTSHIGTSDWPEEQRLLQAISDQYELRRNTRDEARREAIYHAIDSLSHLAAALAVPNEYDKMVKSIGARGTNAYTSTERTVYINDVPSDELERWMMIESERMQECVLRLFHTELETVYEEFNRSQDNDGRLAYYKKNELLYPHHPYGTQTTLGTGEHLKDPSMEKIHAFFSTWYVPNNMAVVLAGDIDHDRTIALVDKYFGSWVPREVPRFEHAPERPLNGPVVAEVTGPDREWATLAWRFRGTGSTDPGMLDLVAGLLSNGRAGLFDLNLVQAQRVLDASAYALEQADHSEFNIRVEPREGQTLEQARDLALEQLDALASGGFEDWLIGAVVNDLRVRRIRQWSDNNGRRAAAMTDAFILRKEWEEVLTEHDRMAAITKDQVMAFVKERLGDDHVCVLKRSGERTGVHKVTKPRITPIDIKREGMSAWRRAWEQVPGAELAPEFVDFATAIERRDLGKGVELASVRNPSNELFSLRYILDMGTDHDKALEVAVKYLPYLGTSRYSAPELRKELFKLGLSLDVFVGNDRCYVTLSGLERNLREGVVMLEHVLAGCRPDEAALRGLIADLRKERQDQARNKGVLLSGALYSQARYGARSPFNDVLTDAELNALKADDLVARIHRLTSYKHRVFHYGRQGIDQVEALLRELHPTPAALMALPGERAYPEVPTTRNEVLFAEYDMVQAEMLMVSKAGPFDVEKMPYAALFNEYFGSGLSSIVFQEIRESKALAYGANASYTTPAEKEEAHYVRAFIGTQADKLPDAVDAMLILMNDMPMAEAQFEGARTAARKVIASTRITRENIYWQWDAARRRGLDTDVRKLVYERIPQITLQDMKAFFDREIKGRPYTYCVIGKESTMDMTALERLGPVRKLERSELFGFEVNP
ncbi:MAG TPA: insulinase family protein [Flavobacteriales bacterium]|nr:insulinase family protein [Flavobacteriales bacterium]HMR27077.1 insulinase family protein [Flavobacteriales bacterium]